MLSCDEERIRQFLTHELTDAEAQDFEEHLSACATCCDLLQDSTADNLLWQDVSQLLRDEPDDLGALARPEAKAIGELPQTESPSQAAVQSVLKWLGPTDDPRMIGRVGNYEVAGVIGAGGMSVVLKALDPSLNRYVAIKVIAPHLAMSGAARQRFAREAQASAAIVHENVIDIHGVSEANGLPFLVMPYVKGESLQKRLDDTGPLRLKEILRIATQTAHGLAAAHAQGLIHRDVKPANILLADGVERVTITDFGLARAADDASLTRTGTIAGTPQYMSPEQARGENVDHRSDLFSLGSVIYAMCTGRAPFRAESSYGVLSRIAESDPRDIREINSDIPDWLCRLVERLHMKSPEDRYQNATDAAEELEQCLAHVNDPTREVLPERLVSPAAAKPGVWRFALPVLASCVLCVGVWCLLEEPRVLHESPPQPSSIAKPTNLAPAIAPKALKKDSSALWEDGVDAELIQLLETVGKLESEFRSDL